MSAVAPLPTFAALHDIRDKAILLSLGKAFLCEEVFLMKIGHSIDESLEHLREDILSLKMRFVGKFVEEVDTDSILDDLHSQASFLQALTAGSQTSARSGPSERNWRRPSGY